MRDIAASQSNRTVEVVLVVDDEECIRELVRRILEDTGFLVIDACNGREALAVCRAYPGPIDILLSDVEMPELGGRELAVGALELRPGLKILLMSGLDENDVLDHRVPAGTAFLQKPFNFRTLAHKLQAAIA